MNRRERITLLLETYRYAAEALQRGDGGATGDNDDGSRSVLFAMPNIWHEGSYSKIVVALAELRRSEPDLYWHVSERYLRSEIRPRMLTVRKGAYVDVPRNWLVRPERPTIAETTVESNGRRTFRAMVVSWDERVEPESVDRAIDRLSKIALGGIWVPKDLLEGRAA